MAETPRRKKPKRYCGMCDKWVPAKETICRACGADTDKAEHDEREIANG